MRIGKTFGFLEYWHVADQIKAAGKKEIPINEPLCDCFNQTPKIMEDTAWFHVSMAFSSP